MGDGAEDWLWAKSAGGISFDEGAGVAVDSNQNTYITGDFMDAAAFGSIILTSQGSTDVFVAKLGTTGENNPPNKPVKHSGKLIGKLNVEYTYSSSTVDPDGDQIFYLFDWGDGNNSGWVGPFDSGATVSVNHTWTVKNTYQVK